MNNINRCHNQKKMNKKFLPLYIVFTVLSFNMFGQSSSPHRYYVPSVYRDHDKDTPRNLYFTTRYSEAVDVHIYTTDGTIDINTTVPSNGVQGVSISNYILSDNENVVEVSKGVIIDASHPVRVSFVISHEYSASLLVSKGQRSLGQEFIIRTQPNTTVNYNNDEVHFASVMAAEDNTIVHFDNNGNDLRGLNSKTHTVTLNAGETFMVLPDENDGNAFDGLKITSNKDIAVNAGETHVGVNGSSTKREGGMTQILPTNRLGKEYAVARNLSQSGEADFVIITAKDNNTDVYFDGNPSKVATINARESHRIDINGNQGTAHFIRTSKDAYVYHYSGMLGNELDLAIVPPIDASLGIKQVGAYKTNQDELALYAIIDNASLTTFKMNGALYSTISNIIVNPIPGKSNWSLVYFKESVLPSGKNVFTSDGSFHMALVSADEISNWNIGNSYYDFISGNNDLVNMLDPNNSSAYINYLLAGNMVSNNSAAYALSLEAFYGGAFVSSAVAQSGSATAAGSMINYTSPTNYCGLDTINVVLEDANGNTSSVIVAVNIDDRPIATIDTFSNTGTAQALDVLNQGEKDYDPASCDMIELVSVETNGVD